MGVVYICHARTQRKAGLAVCWMSRLCLTHKKMSIAVNQRMPYGSNMEHLLKSQEKRRNKNISLILFHLQPC